MQSAFCTGPATKATWPVVAHKRRDQRASLPEYRPFAAQTVTHRKINNANKRCAFLRPGASSTQHVSCPYACERDAAKTQGGRQTARYSPELCEQAGSVQDNRNAIEAHEEQAGRIRVLSFLGAQASRPFRIDGTECRPSWRGDDRPDFCSSMNYVQLQDSDATRKIHDDRGLSHNVALVLRA